MLELVAVYENGLGFEYQIRLFPDALRKESEPAKIFPRVIK